MTDPDQPDARPPLGGWHGQELFTASAAKTNVLAIVSLVAGLVWFFWLGSIAAVICGLLALGQIKARGESGRGIAMTGIVLGCIGMVTLLGAILIGVFLAASAPSGSG